MLFGGPLAWKSLGTSDVRSTHYFGVLSEDRKHLIVLSCVGKNTQDKQNKEQQVRKLAERSLCSVLVATNVTELTFTLPMIKR